MTRVPKWWCGAGLQATKLRLVLAIRSLFSHWLHPCDSGKPADTQTLPFEALSLFFFCLSSSYSSSTLDVFSFCLAWPRPWRSCRQGENGPWLLLAGNRTNTKKPIEIGGPPLPILSSEYYRLLLLLLVAVLVAEVRRGRS